MDDGGDWVSLALSGMLSDGEQWRPGDVVDAEFAGTARACAAGRACGCSRRPKMGATGASVSSLGSGAVVDDDVQEHH